MPQAVIATVVAAGAKIAANAIVGAALMAGVQALAITTFIMSAAAMALAPKPKGAVSNELRGRQEMFKQPLTTRKIIYGRQKVSGPIIFLETANNSDVLHFIVAVAGHEIEEFEKFYFNEDELTLASGTFGNVTAPSQYANNASIYNRLGTDTQTALPSLVTETFNNWSEQHRLLGVAYIYARMVYDPDAFPNGIPNVTAIVKGRKVYDPRTSTTVYSANPALCLRDYLTDQTLGLGASESEIDDASFIVAANICDENVALAAGGTEKRYECHGVVDTGAQPKVIINEILSSMGGTLVYTGGKYYLKAAAYVTPSGTLTEDDLRGAISMTTKASRRDSFNAIKGAFLSPDTNWQPSDYPAITSSTFEAEDGGQRVYTDLDLMFTTSATMAQRLAKITLYQGRQQIMLNMPCKLTAFKYRVGDTVQVTIDRYGFSNKVFEVVGWSLSNAIGDDGSAQLGVDLALRETNSDVYAWDAEEKLFIQDNTNINNGLVVSAPSIAVYDEVRAINQAATTVMIVDLDTSAGNVVEFELQYKKTTDTKYTSAGKSVTGHYEVLNVEDGIAYDIRARGITGLGVRSPYATKSYTTIGKLANPADVTDFSVNIVDTQAHLSWAPVGDADLSHYIIRHTRDIVTPSWGASVLLTDKVARPANSVVVPAMTGTYLIKAVDKLGNLSDNATQTIAVIQSIAGLNVVETSAQAPSFSGTKTNLVVTDNSLILDTSTLFDDATGDFDDATGLFDGGFGSVYSSGSYEFDNYVDLGSKYTSRITANVGMTVLDYVNSFDAATGNFDSREGLFDGDGDESIGSIELQISTTDDDPSGTPTWSAYRKFVVGDYAARAYRFKAIITSESGNATPKVETLTVTVDMPDRVYSDGDISSGTSAKVVTFPVSFKSLQGVAITAQNLQTGDYFTVTSKSATGFTVTFYDSSDIIVDRTFDYTAKGYGELVA